MIQLLKHILHTSLTFLALAYAVTDLEFVHAKSKCYLKTSMMIIIGEQTSQ